MRVFLRLTVASIVLALALPAAGATLKQIRFEAAYDEDNQLAAPVVAGSDVLLSFGEFTSNFDRNAEIARSSGGLFTKGPVYSLDPAVDLASLLRRYLEAEAPKMGFTPGAGGWKIGAKVDEIYVESVQMTGYGAILFHGLMRLDVEISSPDGRSERLPMRFHNYYQQVSGGMNRKTPAETAITHLLMEGSQELLTRLNRSHFHAPPAAGVAGLVANVKAQGAGRLHRELHAIGLSGSADAVPALLERLGREEDENDRSVLINALARLGSPSIIKPLADRYAAEDEDCRWYTLKAMDYVGSAEALAIVRDKGLGDQEFFCQALAGTILGR
jgi:hypothetical protein